MKKLVMALLFCILTVGMASVASAAENRWQYLASNNRSVLFFDTQSFQKTGATTYSVLIQVEYSEAESLSMAEAININTPVAFELSKDEYNFHNKTSRFLASTYYDKNGNVLRTDLATTEWTTIPPNSIGEFIFNATYDYYKKNYN